MFLIVFCVNTMLIIPQEYVGWLQGVKKFIDA